MRIVLCDQHPAYLISYDCSSFNNSSGHGSLESLASYPTDSSRDLLHLTLPFIIHSHAGSKPFPLEIFIEDKGASNAFSPHNRKTHPVD